MTTELKEHPNEFAPDNFEEDIVRYNTAIIDNSKHLCENLEAYLSFVRTSCVETQTLFLRAKFKRTFIRLKYLEDLLYVSIRALNRTANKSKEGIPMDPTSAAIAAQIDSAYGFATVEALKDWMRRPEDETVTVEVDQLLKTRWVAPHSQPFELVQQYSHLSRFVGSASWIYNQKGIVSLTRDKYRLAKQNFVKALGVQNQLVLGAPGSFLVFLLRINLAFVMYKLDHTAEAVRFCNEGLLQGEESLRHLAEDATAASAIKEIAELYTLATFFKNGQQVPELRQQAAAGEEVESARRIIWRVLADAYFLLSEILGTWKK